MRKIIRRKNLCISKVSMFYVLAGLQHKGINEEITKPVGFIRLTLLLHANQFYSQSLWTCAYQNIARLKAYPNKKNKYEYVCHQFLGGKGENISA